MNRKRRGSHNELSSSKQLEQQNNVGVPLPKKNKRGFQQNNDFDILAQLQSYGLETVILEQNTSEEDHNNRATHPKHKNHDNLKITTDLQHDHEHEEFLDYSQLYTKLYQSKNLNFKIKDQMIRKMKSSLNEIRQRVLIPKKQIMQIKLGIAQLFSSMKFAIMQIQNQLPRKIQQFVSEHKAQLISGSRASKQNEKIDQFQKYQRQLNQNKQYINSLESEKLKLMDKVKQLQYDKSNQYNSLYIQNMELKKRLNQLEKQNRNLQIQANTHKEENYKGNMANSFTEHEVQMKHKHVIAMQKFSDEIEKLEAELYEMRKAGEKEASECQRMKRSLEKQTAEINEIVAELQQRQLRIQQSQLEVELKIQALQARENQLVQGHSRVKTGLDRRQYRPGSYHMNEEQHQINQVSSQNTIKKQQGKGNSRIMQTNSRQTLGNCLSADIMRNGSSKHLYLKKQISPKVANHKANLYSIKYDNYDRKALDRPQKNRLTNRISKIQSSIKKQLNSMGYGY